MKKIISSIAVCSLAICALASCGSEKSAKSAKSADIAGKWSIDSLENESIEQGGIIFNDGKGSAYTDSSKMFHFNDEGLVIGSDDDTATRTISKDLFKEEGKTLTIDLSGMELLIMNKLDETEGYNGTYSLDGGILYEQLSAQISGSEENTAEAVDITLIFNGDKSEMIFNDLFDYETKDGHLTLSGNSDVMGLSTDGNSAEYKIEGDKLTIITKNGTETFTRVK
ncbi:hypothetical protein [Ruminococcus sp.]|uniref:hypothetical protein n=1 Tax=Ruminococcus sp. TaxID=41978 RepID=UPI0025D6A7CE|nr:hypothetical protein [Ruminococcus sp.]